MAALCTCPRLPHLGVQRCVSVVSILQLISHQLLGAAKCWIRTAGLLESCLNGVENLLTRDGYKAQVRFVTNDVLAELKTDRFTGQMGTKSCKSASDTEPRKMKSAGKNVAFIKT